MRRLADSAVNIQDMRVRSGEPSSATARGRNRSRGPQQQRQPHGSAAERAASCDRLTLPLPQQQKLRRSGRDGRQCSWRRNMPLRSDVAVSRRCSGQTGQLCENVFFICTGLCGINHCGREPADGGGMRNDASHATASGLARVVHLKSKASRRALSYKLNEFSGVVQGGCGGMASPQIIKC
jgi:hypothetical protein